MGENFGTNSASDDKFSAKAVADYLDFGAARDIPGDPESQKQAASMRLYAAIEENLNRNAPRPADPKCAPYGKLQGYDFENPYGYCGTDNIKTTDRFLEEVSKLEKPGTGLALKLVKSDPAASYDYDVVLPKK